MCVLEGIVFRRSTRLPQTSSARMVWVVATATAVVVTAGGTAVGTAGAAVEAPGSAGAIASVSSACTLNPSGHQSARNEHRSCLSVTANLSQAPVVGARATLDFNVLAAVALPQTRISAELPPGLRWVTRPTGMTASTRVSRAPHLNGRLDVASATMSIAAGQRLRFSGVVEAVAPGAAEINVKATADASGRTHTGADAVFLTVGNARDGSRFGIPVDRNAKTARYSGPKPAQPVTPNPAKPAGTSLVRPATQVAPSAVVQSPFADACVLGSWNYTDRNGNGQAALAWRVEAWDSDAGGEELLATGVTGNGGGYMLCFNNGDIGGEDGQDVFIRFVADNGNWRVQTSGGFVYSYVTGIIADVGDDQTVDFGWLQPGVPNQMRAAAAFAAGAVTWFNTPGACWDVINSCRSVVIRWEPGSTDGTYYDPNTNDVHLAAADPDSGIVVSHEMAHSIMDDVYDDNFPSAPMCAGHQINLASSAGCAWTEGFADWLPLWVYSDSNFRWPDGTVMNLETPTMGTPNWNNGDTVEGRVAGSLLDLSDSNNEGTDRVTERISDIWSTFQNHDSATFAAFWADRTADGFDVGNDALGSLFQNTIDYGFVP